ncbi:MAG TPA: ABC transporter permease [Casimicrobiaceae bacterium]|nr:ABC transporter permease [Casimicrobiaceae bacterium]
MTTSALDAGTSRSHRAGTWRRLARRLTWPRVLAVAYVLLVFVFLLAPIVVVIGGSFSAPENDRVVMSYVEFPPRHLTLKWYAEIPSPQLHALGFSFALAFGVAVAACALGVPAALALVRGRIAAKPLVAAILRAPLQIPHVVTGIALLQFYYLAGDLSGLYLQGTAAGLFLGHLFLATPFVIGSVTAVLQRFNVRLEEAAFTLGASRWRTLRRVTLPIIMPGIFAGGLYAFIVSFVDVPVALFLAGSNRATFPVELFFAMEQDFNPSSLAAASLAAGFALLLVIASQRIVGIDNLLKAKSR